MPWPFYCFACASPPQPPPHHLQKTKQNLLLSAQGYTTEEIADRLFRVIIWRKDEVRGKEGGEVRGEVDDKIKKIVIAIRGNTISANDIMNLLNLKGEDNFRKRYLVPSMEEGYVQMLYPNATKRPDQAYYLTEKGLALFAEISKD